MRHFLLLLLAMVSSFIFAQSIIVNPASAPESALTAEQLTLEVLIDGGECSAIENFSIKHNTNASAQNRSWGYFEKGNSNFPFESGIVLTSGKAKEAEGPNDGPVVSSGSWAGDNDARILSDSGYQSHDATVFEFDFIPQANEISFNYIFASEEYPDYACPGPFGNYNDVFGFIISGPGIVNDPGLSGKNIALLPNGLPVTINNVNDEWCGYEEFYVGGTSPWPAFQDIRYGGRTVPLTAYSEVIAGQTYHIRLLVSDIGDSNYDSAVFLEAGSFSLGSTLMDEGGIELEDVQVVCDDPEYTLYVDVHNPDAIIKWYLEDELIPGESGESLTITESGNYKVTVALEDGCEQEDTVNVLFRISPEVNNYTEPLMCTVDGSYNFNLEDFNSEISTSLDVTYTHYNTEAGAETADADDFIASPQNFPVNGEITVYVRVESGLGCYRVASLTLQTSLLPVMQAQNYSVCDENGDGVVEFDLTTYNDLMVTSSLTDLEFEYYTDPALTQQITSPESFENTQNPQIIYVKTFYANANSTCSATEELTLIVNEFPEIQNWTMPLICDNLNDNYEIIDLTQNELVVTEGINVTLQYFPSFGDMTSGTEEIFDPENYEYTGDLTEIYVSIENGNQTCKEYVVLTLGFNSAPDAHDLTWENCSIDGLFEYHLPDVNNEINYNPDGLEFTYYLSYNNAFDAVQPINENYTNSNPDEIIYVRVENENGCFNISEINLITTHLLHETLNDILEICDDPLSENDGIAEFDLTEMDEEIQNQFGGLNYTVKYYTTLERAQENSDEISNTTQFENTTNTQTIYARVFDGENACIGTAEFLLRVNPVPEFELTPSITFCVNETKFFEFEEQFDSYTWINPNGDIVSNQNSVTFEQGGIYTLEVTSNGFDCPAAREINVIVEPSPIVSEIEVDGNFVRVNVIGNGPFEYSYNNGLTWSPYNTFPNIESGIFYMLVRSANGCISEGKLFGVLGIPNVITPNGDGYNDYMTVRGLEAYPDAHIKIFDRYGKIFIDRNMQGQFEWDGKYMGRPLPSGSYWYIIIVDKDKSLSGHITIKN
ncbi:T9SS type B sorting domain-containing protein [Moheibacter sediminis]|uniref:Gliding motility-associated C-terminal domain-containing protein n=1 Tax=Moheibacter sediminis TaxID=1434700 RepID=A0A1W1ZAF3_9FLAO|nr:choice-of-anchor L domain-containing protein [Moheibacter sediminis]SMC45384.1 gliding motility-associated C-terminal domain-containing protein [Moheibacter sediminis]